MKKVYLIFIILLSILLLNSFCPGIEKPETLPFRMNEKLIFSVSYGILTGGTYTMSITDGDSSDGKPVYTITSRANTNTVFDIIYKVRDVMKSYWDKEDFFSKRYIKRISEGGWKQYRIQYFFPSDTTAYDVKYKKGRPIRKKFKGLPFPQDELSIFYYIRCQDLQVGDSLVTNIISSGDAYRTRIDVLDKVKMETIFGERECFLVKPFLKYIVKDNVNFYIWLLADEQKIPVKLVVEVKYGKFTFNLKDAENVDLKIVD